MAEGEPERSNVLNYARIERGSAGGRSTFGTVLLAMSFALLAFIQWSQPGGAMRSYRILDPEHYYGLQFAAGLALGAALFGIYARWPLSWGKSVFTSDGAFAVASVMAVVASTYRILAPM